MNFRRPWPNGPAIKQQGDILPVEVFMRDVYRHLQSVQTIHQNFFERLTEQRQKGEKHRELIEPGIYLEGGRIYLESAKVILDNPSVLMKLFWYALKKEARLSQETIRLIKQCLYLVDEDFQHSRLVSELVSGHHQRSEDPAGIIGNHASNRTVDPIHSGIRGHGLPNPI